MWVLSWGEARTTNWSGTDAEAARCPFLGGFRLYTCITRFLPSPGIGPSTECGRIITHMVVNRHREGSAGIGNHPRHEVAYNEDEDDTRAYSSAHSSNSHKASSRHSQDAVETETDNSEDLSHEDLASALSYHLNSTTASSQGQHDVISNHNFKASMPQHHYHQTTNPKDQNTNYNGDVDHLRNVNNNESHRVDGEHINGKLDSEDSDNLYSVSPPSLSHNPFEQVPGELKLDLTCFDDNELRNPALQKGTEQRLKDKDSSYALNLSMKPSAGLTEAVLSQAETAQTAPPREKRKSLTENKLVTPILPKHSVDVVPNAQNTIGQVAHGNDLDTRPPVRRSVTPNQFSVAHQSSYRRATTPSVELLTESSTSKGGRRARKDHQATSSENLKASFDDVTLSASKKKPFRTSLKNLFQRKKGSVILDELEREYTKELVRRCLEINGHSITNQSNNHTKTPISCSASTATNKLHNINGIHNDVDIISGNVDFDKNQNGLSTGLSENNHHNHSNNIASFWAKMRKSPLFFIYRNADNEAGGTTV